MQTEQDNLAPQGSPLAAPVIGAEQVGAEDIGAEQKRTPADSLFDLRFIVGVQPAPILDLKRNLPLIKGASEIFVAPNYAALVDFVDADFADAQIALIRNAASQMLGLAQKAGAAHCGFNKAHSALENLDDCFLLNACDGAEGGAKKLAHKAKAVGAASASIFSVSEQSAALKGGVREARNTHHIVLDLRRAPKSLLPLLDILTNLKCEREENE